MCHWVTYPMERTLGLHLCCPCPGAGSTSCAATQARRSGKSLDALHQLWFGLQLCPKNAVQVVWNIISQFLRRTGYPKSSFFTKSARSPRSKLWANPRICWSNPPFPAGKWISMICLPNENKILHSSRHGNTSSRKYDIVKPRIHKGYLL